MQSESAFELVKQAEATAADRIRLARQQAAALQNEAEEEIKGINRRLEEKLTALQAELSVEENEAIREAAAARRRDWEEERLSLQKTAERNQDYVINLLMKRVFFQDGNC